MLSPISMKNLMWNLRQHCTFNWFFDTKNGFLGDGWNKIGGFKVIPNRQTSYPNHMIKFITIYLTTSKLYWIIYELWQFHIGIHTNNYHIRIDILRSNSIEYKIIKSLKLQCTSLIQQKDEKWRLMSRLIWILIE